MYAWRIPADGSTIHSQAAAKPPQLWAYRLRLLTGTFDTMRINTVQSGTCTVCIHCAPGNGDTYVLCAQCLQSQYEFIVLQVAAR